MKVNGCQTLDSIDRKIIAVAVRNDTGTDRDAWCVVPAQRMCAGARLSHRVVAEKTAGDDAWSASGTGMNWVGTSVNAIAISGTDVYAGGSFNHAGGKVAQGVAKYSVASYKVYLPLVLRGS